MQDKNKVCYLGLDISTSIIGFCLINYKKELVLLDYIDLRKIKCIFEKSVVVKEKLLSLKKEYKFSDDFSISIEEAFQSFSKGFSSARTLSQLNRFNGIVSYQCYETFNSVPCYINVNSARKNLQIKINKKLNINTKEQVFQWVQNDIQNFEWPMKTLILDFTQLIVFLFLF